MRLPRQSLLGVVVAASLLTPSSKALLLEAFASSGAQPRPAPASTRSAPHSLPRGTYSFTLFRTSNAIRRRTGLPGSPCVLPTTSSRAARHRLVSTARRRAASRPAPIFFPAAGPGDSNDSEQDRDADDLTAAQSDAASNDGTGASSSPSSDECSSPLHDQTGAARNAAGCYTPPPPQSPVRSSSFGDASASTGPRESTREGALASSPHSMALPDRWLYVAREGFEGQFPATSIRSEESARDVSTTCMTAEAKTWQNQQKSIAQDVRRPLHSIRRRQVNSLETTGNESHTGGRDGDENGARAEDVRPALEGRWRCRSKQYRVEGGRKYDADELPVSPLDEMAEATVLQVAALAAARRGTGERQRLVESEAPVEEFFFRGRRVLVKRDDKMRLAGSGMSGNKARKLYALNKTPDEDFPRLVVSHGGHQSNAMVAIAAIVADKQVGEFVYYTKPVPRWLRRNPVGNFARARALGAKITELNTDDYKRIFGGLDGPGSPSSDIAPEGALFLPQGGADALAEEGVSMLAEEIVDYWKAVDRPGQSLKVVVPAGTGTTALFLARHLIPEGIAVSTVPCAGDGEYLLRQMVKVDRASGNHKIFPGIMEGRVRSAFGVPRLGILETWRELDSLGLFVDLIYAAPTWEVILEQWDEDQATKQRKSDTEESQLMYVHCGGLEGVSSQLTRYKHQGLVKDRQLQ